MTQPEIDALLDKLERSLRGSIEGLEGAAAEVAAAVAAERERCAKIAEDVAGRLNGMWDARSVAVYIAKRIQSGA